MIHASSRGLSARTNSLLELERLKASGYLRPCCCSDEKSHDRFSFLHQCVVLSAVSVRHSATSTGR
jgi:hypothetical protein